MNRNKKSQRIKAALLLLPLVALGGCIEYGVETTLREDGSGRREVRIELSDTDDLEDMDLTLQDFRTLLTIREDQGWRHGEAVKDSDTTHVFSRERQVGDLRSWSELNDEIHILGAMPSRAASEVGYVALGDVHFRNRILVGTSMQSDGTASFSYQETFFWENGVDAFLEVVLAQLDEVVAESYRNLSARERGEILGFARARLWAAVDQGVLDASGGDEDRLWREAVDLTAAQAIKIVRRRHPDAEAETLRDALRTGLLSDEADDELEERLVALLPGFSLSINSSITFRLTMPGRVIDSNAHEVDGSTLVWEFSPTDALTAPVVVMAESVVGG